MPGTNHNYAAKEYAYPADQVQSWLKDPSSAPEKLVFLTFDDGPNHSTSLAVLDVLRKFEVPATFFVVGRNIDDAPEVLRQEIAEGHAVANHSFSHDYKKLYPNRVANPEQVDKEVAMTNEALREALGDEFNTTAWRYPGGHMSWQGMSAADNVLTSHGMSWIDWNSLTGDAEPESRRPTTVEEMVRLATQPIAEGVPVSVMLAHDSENKEMTVASLPEIIRAYQQAGYRFAVIA